VIILVVGFLIIKKSSEVAGNPLRAIPYDAAVIIKINEYDDLIREFTRENKLWQQLSTIPSFAELERQIRYIDSLMNENSNVRALILNTPAFLSLHFTGKADVSTLHVFSLPKGLISRDIHELIIDLTGDSGSVVSRKYEGTDMFDVRFMHSARGRNFSYCIHDGLMLVSFSSILLEDAVRQTSLSSGIMNDMGFNKVNAVAGKNVIANIFINYKHFPKTLSVFANQKSREKIRDLDNLADWSELDLNIKSELLMLNGFTFANDSLKKQVNIFLDQDPQKLAISKVLPSNISTFMAVGFESFKEYMQEYRRFLRMEGKLTSDRRDLDEISRQYGINIESIFTSIVDNEMCIAFDDQPLEGQAQNVFAFFKIKSQAQAEKELGDLLQTVARKEKKTANNYMRKYKLDNVTEYTIFHLDLDLVLQKMAGDVFGSIDDHYFVFYNSYLIFSNSPVALQNLLHSNVLHKTLENDATFRKFADNMSARSNLFFYTNLSRSLVNFTPFLSSDVVKVWKEYNPVFQNVQTLGFQLNTSGSMLYTNLALMYFPVYHERPHTVWETLLDTVADFKPAFVLNHYTKENEIFVQDLNNNVYLINQAGRILWRIPLPEKIMSDVYQIDYYKNGKLQILFSTGNYLHLIDRNGNYVERFPVKLRSPATNGMALFDYEGNRNYRIFVACENRKVYAYAKDGSIISGWQFDQSEGIVKQPVKHFRVGSRDYIVFGDQFRTYVLNRRGQVRTDVRVLFPKSENNNYLLDSDPPDADARFACTDTAGTVYFFYFDGNIEKLKIKDFSADHYFDLKDVNNDGAKDLIFLDDDKLEVFGLDKNLIYDYDFDASITDRPVYFHFSASDRKIGLVSKDENKIFLINNDGSLYDGFPLQGSTLFSIGYLNDGLSQFNLIVGNNDNFLYNYAVQ